MKRILVTGGNGFIGSYVVKGLLRRGLQPVSFDRTFKSVIPGVEVHMGDVRDFTAVFEGVGRVEGVIHLAGVLGTQETVNEPRPAVDTNLYGTLNVLQACRAYNRRLTYISVGNHWMNNSYAITKDMAERFCWMFAKEHGLEVSVVRGLNAYGPGQKSWPVRKIIPNFVIPALKNEEITVYGDGSQIMDMIYVENLADILIRSLLKYGSYAWEELDERVPKFEAGTGRQTTVQQIATLVIKMIGRGSIKNVPMRPGEEKGSVVLGNPNTLKPLYGGNLPELVSLENGLVPTIKHYAEWLNA